MSRPISDKGPNDRPCHVVKKPIGFHLDGDPLSQVANVKPTQGPHTGIAVGPLRFKAAEIMGSMEGKEAPS